MKRALIIAAALAVCLGGLLGYKAYAANAEITESDYKEMSWNQRGHLLDCQFDKLKAQYPQDVVNKVHNDYMDSLAGAEGGSTQDFVPVQLTMMKEYDISCSFPEIKPKPITAEQVGALDDDESAALLDCQMKKLALDMGTKESVNWVADEMTEGLIKPGATKPYTLKDWKSDKDIVPIQQIIIEEKRVSCTEDEMWKYAG